MKNMTKNIKLRNKGFTLVELIVVLVLISIILGITVFSAIAWMDWSRFKHNEATAEEIFYAAQNQLAELEASGAYDRKINEALLVEVAGETEGETTTAYRNTLVSSTDSGDFPAMDDLFDGHGNPYDWEAIWTNDSNIDSHTRSIVYLKAKLGDYKLYSDNRNSVDPDTRLLFDLIAPYIADKSVLNHAIVLEFSPEAGQVFSVCYTEQQAELTYDDPAPANSICIKNRELSRREEAMFGYFGVDTLTARNIGRSRDKKSYDLQIKNDNVLSLILTSDENGFSTSELEFYIKGTSDYINNNYENVMKFTIGVPDGTIGSLDQAVLNPTDVDIELLDGIYLTSTDEGGEETTLSSVTETFRLPVWREGNSIYIVLDAMDVQAQSLTYAGIRGRVTVPEAQAAKLKEDSKNAFINTYSFYRFGLVNTKYIRASVKIGAQTYDSRRYDPDPSDDVEYEVYGTPGSPNGERTTFANFDEEINANYSDFIAAENGTTDDGSQTGDDSSENEDAVVIDYGIQYARHLYNVRFETDYKSSEDDAKVFLLENNINWQDSASTYFFNSKPSSGIEGKVYGIDFEGILTNVENAQHSSVADMVQGLKVYPFPGFRMLGYGDTFTQLSDLTPDKWYESEDEEEDTETSDGHYILSGFNISYIWNCIYGVYGGGAQFEVNGKKYQYNNATVNTYSNEGKKGSHPLGLFAENYGTITNLELEDIVVSGVEKFPNASETPDQYVCTSKVGGFVGNNLGVIKNLYVDYTKKQNSEDAEIISHISGRCDVGGIIGHQLYLAGLDKVDAGVRHTISGCINEAEVTGVGYVGGITGRVCAAADVSSANFQYVDIDNNYSNGLFAGLQGIKQNKISHFWIDNCKNYGDIAMDKLFVENENPIGGNSRRRGFFYGGITGAAINYYRINDKSASGFNYTDAENANVKIFNCESYTVYSDAELNTILSMDLTNSETLRRFSTSFVGNIVGGSRYAFLVNNNNAPEEASNVFVFGDRYVGGITGYAVESVLRSDPDIDYTKNVMERLIPNYYRVNADKTVVKNYTGYRDDYAVINGSNVVGNYAVGGICGAFGRPDSNVTGKEFYGTIVENAYGRSEYDRIPYGSGQINNSTNIVKNLLNTAIVLGTNYKYATSSTGFLKDANYYGIGGVAGLCSVELSNCDNIQTEAVKLQNLKYVGFILDGASSVSDVINVDSPTVVTDLLKVIVDSKFSADGVGG